MNRSESRTLKNTLIANNLCRLDATAADLDAYAKEIGAGHFDRYERGYMSRKADVAKSDVYVNLVTGRPYYYAPAYNTTQYKIRVYTDCKAKDFLEWLREKRAADEKRRFVIVRLSGVIKKSNSREELVDINEQDIIASALIASVFQDIIIRVVADYPTKKQAQQDLSQRRCATKIYKVDKSYFMDATIFYLVEKKGNKEVGKYEFADFE